MCINCNFLGKKFSTINIYMFLCKQKNQLKTQNMSTIIKNLGLALILIGAVILLLSYFLNWVNNNAVSVAAIVTMLAGLLTYIFASKKELEKN